MSGKVSTADVLRRRGLSLGTIFKLCVLCNKDMETIDHLFLHYEFAFSLWCRFLKMSGILQCLPGSLERLFEAWRLVFFLGCGGVLWRLITFAILWLVW